jgi:ubiquinone biosynthesis protein COQ4
MQRSTALSPFGRAALAVGSAVLALRDPSRADMVALLGDATAGPLLRRLSRQVSASSPIGRDMVHTQSPARFPGPDCSLQALRALPPGSLGAEYAAFMDTRGFDPHDRPTVHRALVPDPRDAWVLQRYRDVHDLWHVLLGMPTTVLGELAQKWFEAAHTGLPAAVLSAAVGPARLSADERRVLFRDLAPWAAKAGSYAVDLLAVRYEDHLHRDLNDVRDEWCILSTKDFLREPGLFYKKRKKKGMPDEDGGVEQRPVVGTEGSRL